MSEAPTWKHPNKTLNITHKFVYTKTEKGITQGNIKNVICKLRFY